MIHNSLMLWKNKLFFGDNLKILRQIKDESVDLIYLDPPFNSKATYNVLFREANGTASASQIKAFEDTWHWDSQTERTFRELVEHGPQKLADLIVALRQFLGTNDMMAYLVMMAIRLAELHRVLKPTGSIYLHCDPTASHYLKLVMDAVFGGQYFKNEIVWKRTTAKSLAFKRYASNHDILLYYSKSDKTTWNSQYTGHNPEYVEKFYRFTEPETGRRYRLGDLTNPNKDRPNLTYEFLGVTRVWRWTKERMQEAYEKGLVVQNRPGGVPAIKRYLDEQKGTPVDDVWIDIMPVQSQAAERLGYPTQKPEALLERIILASSNEGDIVLDPFCGCGTTIAVAERLKRRWIGIDITHLAIALMKYRLESAFGDDLSPYKIIGEPQDLAGARALAAQDPFEFQKWAVSLVRGMPIEGRGADRGIDGYINFFDDRSGRPKKIIIQVKSGRVGSPVIRDLKGVIVRERAVIGVLITLNEPTREMVKEAASAGFYESEHFGSFPKIQILTIRELLQEKKEINMPPRGADVTIKKAKRVEREVAQTTIDDIEPSEQSDS